MRRILFSIVTGICFALVGILAIVKTMHVDTYPFWFICIGIASIIVMVGTNHTLKEAENVQDR